MFSEILVLSGNALQSENVLRLKASELLEAGNVALLLTELRVIADSENKEEIKGEIEALIRRTEAFSSQKSEIHKETEVEI